jgi:hypothetical protein
MLRAPTLYQQASALQRMVDRCDRDWGRNQPSEWETIFDLANVRYDLCANSRIRKVALRLDDGTVLRGFLGLKPGGARRPLILVRCGLFCDAGDMSHRFLFMHLFDESPFNVLGIGNATGAEFVADNQYISVGGLAEGIQFQRIARLIARSPLARLVSSYHLASVSLGSQGVLFASYINQFNVNAGTPPFASALALCPVVNLPESSKTLFDGGWKGLLAKSFFGEVLGAIAYIPGLRFFFPKTDSEEIPIEAANASVAHLSQLPRDWFLPPFSALRIHNRKDFWNANRFLPLAPRGTSVPTLAFAAANDWIVPTAVNAAPLARTAPVDGNLGVAIAARGNHCAFSMAYGWETATEIYRSFFLSRSPDLLATRRVRQASIDADWLENSLGIGPQERFSRFEFSAQAQSPKLDLRVAIWTRYATQGICGSPYDPNVSCLRERRLAIPLARFAPAPWATPPRNDVEAEALARFANANLLLTDRASHPSLGTQNAPAFIRWESYLD